MTEELRKYELMVIISGDMLEADFEKELGELRKFIQENTKGISYEDNWGRRDLAYRIKRQGRGYYVVFNFAASPDQIAELRINLKLNPNVLRHLLITVPETYDPVRYKTETLPQPETEEKRSKRVARTPAVEKASMEQVAASVEKPVMPGKEQEEELKKVEKKLEKILENPDIDIK